MYSCQRGGSFHRLSYNCYLLKSQECCGNKEAHPNENRGYLLRAGYLRGVNHLPLLCGNSKAGQGQEGFKAETGECSYVPIGGCWHKEAGGSLTRCSLWVRFGEHLWFSLVGVELESGVETGAAGCHRASPQFLSLSLQRSWFNFPAWSLPRMWVRVLQSLMV